MSNKVIAMIPARLGSQRIKYKNLRLLNGYPLIYYPIKACLDAKIFDRVILNSEVSQFEGLASQYGAEFYHRPEKYAQSSTKADEVVYDFVKNNPCDIVFWVNPTAPLQKSFEIKEALDYFIKNNLDSMITTQNNQVHSLFKGKPINFSEEGLFAKTQDLEPVQTCVFTFMAWRTSSFIKEFNKNGYAFLSGKIGYYNVSKLSGIDIDNEEDFQIAEYILKAINSNSKTNATYHNLLDKILNS